MVPELVVKPVMILAAVEVMVEPEVTAEIQMMEVLEEQDTVLRSSQIHGAVEAQETQVAMVAAPYI